MSYGVTSYGERSYGSLPTTDGATLATLAETLELTGSVTGPSIFGGSVSDAASFGELLAQLATTPVFDSFTLNDSTAYDFGAYLLEIISWDEEVIADLIAQRTFADELVLTDTVYQAFGELLSESLQINDTVAFVKFWANTLTERLNLTDVADPVSIYGKLIASALAFTDLAAHWEYETLSDELVAQDLLQGAATLYEGIVESILAGDSTSYLAIATQSLSDTADFADAATQEAIFEALFDDSFTFSVWDGEDQSVYTGWVMNPAVGGITEYNNYNFNSIAKIGTSYYGANDSGIYLLEGADDAGTDIAVRIKMGAFDFGAGYKSRVPQAYIGVRTDGKIIVKTYADDGKERWYETQALHGDLSTQRAKLGKGVVSRYWQFELVNRAGEEVELEQIEFLPVVLTRRV